MNLLNLIYPKRCVGCQKIGTYFCPDCVQNIKQTDLVCPFCEKLSIGGVVHPICIRKFGLNGLWSLGIYENPLRLAIQKLKYRFINEIAEVLINITIDYWARYSPKLIDELRKDQGREWGVVSVPLHWKRQNWRGFNQSELLGRLLAEKLGLKYIEALTRNRETKQQVGLESYKRKANIKNAFSLVKNQQLTTNILLVDDVWTTGSTLRECCYVLKKNGAKKVWALTLAR